jgi:uncharacterized membrane protein
MKENKHYIPLTDPQSFQRRLKSRRRVIQSFEAKSNLNRNVSEKVADFITSHLGSMGFLFFNILWFSIWVIINIGFISAIKPFDPFPFGLLTMIVSLEAICLAIVVLISQNRAAKIDDLREEIDLHINTISEEEITKMMELQVLLLKKNGVDVSNDPELMQMLVPMDLDSIEKSIEKQIG